MLQVNLIHVVIGTCGNLSLITPDLSSVSVPGWNGNVCTSGCKVAPFVELLASMCNPCDKTLPHSIANIWAGEAHLKMH